MRLSCVFSSLFETRGTIPALINSSLLTLDWTGLPFLSAPAHGFGCGYSHLYRFSEGWASSMLVRLLSRAATRPSPASLTVALPFEACSSGRVQKELHAINMVIQTNFNAGLKRKASVGHEVQHRREQLYSDDRLRGDNRFTALAGLDAPAVKSIQESFQDFELSERE